MLNTHSSDIYGEKVILCRKTLYEALRDFRWQRDAGLMALNGYSRLEETFAQYLTQCVSAYKKQPSHEIFSIKTTSNFEHIGNCAVYEVNRAESEAQIGILIGEPDYWDLGFGSEAVTLLVDHVFRDMGLNRIFLQTRTDNPRAVHCFGKCGFKEYGSLSRGGYDFKLMDLFRTIRT